LGTHLKSVSYYEYKKKEKVLKSRNLKQIFDKIILSSMRFFEKVFTACSTATLEFRRNWQPGASGEQLAVGPLASTTSGLAIRAKFQRSGVSSSGTRRL
jgi:hypothetical protein